MYISAVIITRNEGHIIGKTLQSLRGVVNDIVIIDSGSRDHTLEICRNFNANIIETGWGGYGPNKNKGIDAAKNDWILNLDADEVLDDTLRQSLMALKAENPLEVFEMQFTNFFLEKRIRHGEWGRDKHIRLFNRRTIKWNEAAVHENLALPPCTTITLVKGTVLHYTVHSLEEYQQKTISYAMLNAQKYFEQNRKRSVIKLYLAPLFSFLKNYIFRLGFLDGAAGFMIARTTARYTYLKYAYLDEMMRKGGNSSGQ